MVVTFKYLRLLFIISPVFIFHPPSFLTLLPSPPGPAISRISLHSPATFAFLNEISRSLSLLLVILSSISSNEACIRVNSLKKKKKKGLFISIINDGVARTTNNGPGNNYIRVSLNLSYLWMNGISFVVNLSRRCIFIVETFRLKNSG